MLHAVCTTLQQAHHFVAAQLNLSGATARRHRDSGPSVLPPQAPIAFCGTHESTAQSHLRNRAAAKPRALHAFMLHTQRCNQLTTSAVYRRRVVACGRLPSSWCWVGTLFLAYTLPPQHLLSVIWLADDAAELAPPQRLFSAELSLHAQRCSSHTISIEHNQRTIA